ncbi:unnamed protein product [Cuscuta epithymum]|uniref:Uncharacterized protein n=1 Tax=Cuscuta epithymum TaxID=186058 RepID=A0AAV0EK18_9ASTE|nr:unnamed protein product [Cuscuta epithymum]
MIISKIVRIVSGLQIEPRSGYDCWVQGYWSQVLCIRHVFSRIHTHGMCQTLLNQKRVSGAQEDHELELEDNWGPPARGDLGCDLFNLKIVELIGLADANLGGEPLLTLPRVILERATTL